jgi:hypothetical protein
VASDAREMQRHDFEPWWWAYDLIWVPGAGHSFYLDDNSWNEPGAWSRAAGWRSPHMRERRAEWRVGGPRARESDVLRQKRRSPRVLGVSGLGVSSLRRVISRGATALRRGVLHGNDPLGV